MLDSILYNVMLDVYTMNNIGELFNENLDISLDNNVKLDFEKLDKNKKNYEDFYENISKLPEFDEALKRIIYVYTLASGDEFKNYITKRDFLEFKKRIISSKKLRSYLVREYFRMTLKDKESLLTSNEEMSKDKDIRKSDYYNIYNDNTLSLNDYLRGLAYILAVTLKGNSKDVLYGLLNNDSSFSRILAIKCLDVFEINRYSDYFIRLMYCDTYEYLAYIGSKNIDKYKNIYVFLDNAIKHDCYKLALNEDIMNAIMELFLQLCQNKLKRLEARSYVLNDKEKCLTLKKGNPLYFIDSYVNDKSLG